MSGHASVLDNERVRGWRLMLQPASPCRYYTNGTWVRIVEQGGYCGKAHGKTDHELNLNRGDFAGSGWNDETVRNVGPHQSKDRVRVEMTGVTRTNIKNSLPNFEAQISSSWPVQNL